MNLIRKKAPRRWSRAIVTLAARTGNKLMSIRNNDRAPNAARDKEINGGTEDFSYVRLSERTTITVETERLLVVSHKRLTPEEQNTEKACPERQCLSALCSGTAANTVLLTELRELEELLGHKPCAPPEREQS
jgi:hypothetical protein